MHSAHCEGLAEPEMVKRLKETFMAIDVRWNVAGKSRHTPFYYYSDNDLGFRCLSSAPGGARG